MPTKEGRRRGFGSWPPIIAAVTVVTVIAVAGWLMLHSPEDPRPIGNDDFPIQPEVYRSEPPDGLTLSGGRPSTPPEGVDPTEVAPAPPETDAPAATLHAAYEVTLNWLGRVEGTVTITNSGDTPAEAWTLTMELPGDTRVDAVFGAAYTQDGATVTFTPTGAGVGPGAAVEFTFYASPPSDGPYEPESCTLDGGDCAPVT